MIDFNDFETETGPRPATERQIGFVVSLREQFDKAKADYRRIVGEPFESTKWGPLPTTMTEASSMIESGKAAVAAMRAQRNAAREALSSRQRVELDEGMWISGTVGEEGCRVFKIQAAVHGSGRLYVKELIDGSFEYLPGGMRLVAETSRKMTLDEAKAFGKLYGTCCKCGRTLTDENSIEAGIGPVCAGKGW